MKAQKKIKLKEKLENMQLQERINYSYKTVITMMLISGLVSVIAIGILSANIKNYVSKVNAADLAVKTCRIDVNIAARNIREMALNDDKSSYADYEETVEKYISDINTQLDTIRKSGVVPKDLCDEYEDALSEWGYHG